MSAARSTRQDAQDLQGGKIDFAGVTVEKAQYLDLEKEAQRVMMAQ